MLSNSQITVQHNDEMDWPISALYNFLLNCNHKLKAKLARYINKTVILPLIDILSTRILLTHRSIMCLYLNQVYLLDWICTFTEIYVIIPDPVCHIEQGSHEFQISHQ